jgi:micrococcal nuclease
MTVERGKVVPFRPRKRRGRPRADGLAVTAPRRARSSWRRAMREVRPWIIIMCWITAAYIASLPGAFEPPMFLQTGTQTIDARFTLCEDFPARNCVIDGDTFRLGRERVRIVGIDTAEKDARCPAEAEQAARSERALQEWLNRGPFLMAARFDRPIDRYGRALRILRRIRPDGTSDNVANYMQVEGGARSYFGGMRSGWC